MNDGSAGLVGGAGLRARGAGGAGPGAIRNSRGRSRYEVIGSLAAVLAAAVLYGLAFPPADLGAAAWVALVPYLIAVRGVRTRAAVLLALFFALAACATTIGWLPRAAAGYFLQPLVVGVVAWLGVALLMIAPGVMVFTLAYRNSAALPAWARPLFGAAAWTAVELGRTRLLGNPFALLGATQTSVPLLIQIADLGGVYAVSFALAAVNVGLAEAWLTLRAGRGWRAAAAPLTAAATCVGLQLAYGAVLLSGAEPHPLGARIPPATSASAASVPVLVVQGNVDLGTQWRDEFFGRNLDVYLRQTLEGLKARPARLVVWPENAMSFFVADEPLYREAIGRVLSFGRAELVAGGPTIANASPEQFFNSAFALAPDGEVRGRYDKQRLLPFAEYFPLPGLDLLRRSFGRVREFTPGGPAALLPTAAGPAGVLICNEILFPELAAARARAGAGALLNLTHDGWIGDPDYADAALEVAALRAVEQRRWVLRASTIGPSAIIDSHGRIVARTGFGTRAALAGTFAPRSGATVYARSGDAFALVCGLAAAGGVLIAYRRS